MIPLKLTLKGFIGIRDGMGRTELVLDLESVAGALVAITGPNGTGKTTILDNLHPYRIMPSRSKSYSADSFSYWGQVFGGEARKVLEWEHEGVRYKSDIIFRTSGKTQKPEAYLQFLGTAEGAGWAPYIAADGTISDGKTSTYDTCVEAILGTPELYFTAAFSCQGRKLLSGYTNAEIKSLLSSLLGLGHIQDLAVSANEKRLTAERGLQALRDSGTEHFGVHDRRDANVAAQEENKDTILRLAGVRDAARAAVATNTNSVAHAKAKQAQAEESEQRAAGLKTQLASLLNQENAELTEARAARDAAAAAVTEGKSRHESGLARLRQQRQAQEQELKGQETLVARRAEVDKAISDAVQMETDLGVIDAQIEEAQDALDKLQDMPSQAAALDERVHGLSRDIASSNDKLVALRKRSELVDKVPCAGMDLQSSCDLLKDARGAREQLTVLEQEHQQKVATHVQAVKDAAQAQERAKEYAALHSAQNTRNTQRSALLKRMDAVRGIAAMKAAVDQAEASASRIRDSITATGALITDAERARDAEVPALEKASADATGKPLAVQEKYKALREPIQKDLATLPTAASAAEAVTTAESGLSNARARLDDAEKALDGAKATMAKLEAEKVQLDALAEKASGHEAKVATAADDLAHWTTLCKALGPNGVIALVIDDAGPTLAAIINDLLRAAYGPQFSVRIDTQHQNGDGTFREDFDIVVFDSFSNESKSLTDMSPGQQTWVNDAICCGTAVFMSQQSSRDYECRMSDESDGALDAEKKQQYMEMKRQVLKIAGLDREFFISHSTATWALADAVIDLGKYVVTTKQPVAQAA